MISENLENFIVYKREKNSSTIILEVSNLFIYLSTEK